MKYIVTCREMKMLDSHTIQKKGIPSLVLMERAALKTAEEIEAHFREHPGQQKMGLPLDGFCFSMDLT